MCTIEDDGVAEVTFKVVETIESSEISRDPETVSEVPFRDSK